MVLVVRNWLVERGQIRIDQEMMMARIGLLRAGRRYAHTMQPEVNRRFWTDYRAVLEVDEFNFRPRRGGGRSSRLGGLRKRGGYEKKARNGRDRRPSRQPHGRS